MYCFVETSMTHIHTHKMDCLGLFMLLWEAIHLISLFLSSTLPPYLPLSRTHTHKHTRIHTLWSNYKHFRPCGPSSLTQRTHPSLPYLISPVFSPSSSWPCSLCNLYFLPFFSFYTNLHISSSLLSLSLSLTLSPPLSVPIPQTDIIWGNGDWFSSTRFPPSLYISQGFFSYLTISIKARTHPSFLFPVFLLWLYMSL